ncbi:MAG: hypothetical protein ACOYXA_01615 [Bacteroidota bacterium]
MNRFQQNINGHLALSACALFAWLLTLASAEAQVFLAVRTEAKNRQPVAIAAPLDELVLVGQGKHQVTVSDGSGAVYFRFSGTLPVSFRVGGTLGQHRAEIRSSKNQTLVLTFQVQAKTSVKDNQHYGDMFKVLLSSMQTDTGSVQWNGQRYRYFVPWGLDHCHTMKGLKYFYRHGGEFVDLMRKTQRDDGMIYSFVQYQPNMDYWRTRDAWSGYTQKIGNLYFVRQPTENHPEYIFVKTLYQWWKASANDAWMASNLTAAAKALDYGMRDRARWSQRFGLLKRVYTIDSWDFQVEDEYLPDLGLTNSMVVDPDRSKFGIFFGDNTGYIMACRQLAEMLTHVGRTADAAVYQQRADALESRLDALSWNGRFYTHFIEEDSTVHRNLGVDEKTQIAQSNTYSINRGIGHEKSKAILETYLDLKKNLPVGSPGEWYAIYPPFERGFEGHNAKWQYMNGGVAGHAAGELARGAFEHGYEEYGVDILQRLYELGKKYNNKIYFSYTGSLPPPPPAAVYTPIDLAPFANMDTWSEGSSKALRWMNNQRSGDDLRQLPVGSQQFSGIDFYIADPARNDRRAVVAIARREGFPAHVNIPIGKKAGALYLLHTSGKPSSENLAATLAIEYEDGTRAYRNLIMGKHLAYWWFTELKTEFSGVAWYGENLVSKGVGLSWCAIDNPFPNKTIRQVRLAGAEDGTIYTLLGLTLSDQPHYVAPKGPSFGGPDNWAAATAMGAFVEGLMGVKDSPRSQGFQHPQLSPRWVYTSTDSVFASVVYPAADNYVAYRFTHQRVERTITILATSGGTRINCHWPLPKGIARPQKLQVNGKALNYAVSRVEDSHYVDFELDARALSEIVVYY